MTNGNRAMAHKSLSRGPGQSHDVTTDVFLDLSPTEQVSRLLSRSSLGNAHGIDSAVLLRFFKLDPASASRRLSRPSSMSPA